MQGRNILFAYLGVAVPALVALLLYPSLIRNLGVDRFGALSLVLSIAIFFGSFDFGVGLAVTRYVARLDGRNRSKEAIRRLVGHAIWLQSIIGILVAVFLLSVHQIWGLFRAPPGAGLTEEFNRALLWLAVSIPLALTAGVVRCGLEGIGRYGIANALRAPASIGIFAVPIATSFITTRIDILIFTMLVTRVATTLGFMIVWSTIIPCNASQRHSLINLRRHAKVLLNYGGWVMVGTAAGGMIVLGVLDRTLIARLLDVSTLIYYAVPSDVIIRGLLIPSAIASVLITALTKTVVANIQLAPKVHFNAMGVIASQVGPIVVLLVINADWLLGMLTHQPVAETSVQIFKGMATGYFIHAIAHVPYCGLQAAGAPKAASLRHLVQLPVYVIGSTALLLNDQFGLMGWLWCFWAMVDLLMLLFMVRRLAPLQHSQKAIANPLVLLWAGLTMFANVMSTLQTHEALILVISITATLLFLWQLARMLITSSLFE